MAGPFQDRRVPDVNPNELQRYFDDGIKQAIRPYNPDEVHIRVSEDIGGVRTIRIGISGIRRTYEFELDILGNPIEVVDAMIEKVAALFAADYIEPNESSIQLSTN